MRRFAMAFALSLAVGALVFAGCARTEPSGSSAAPSTPAASPAPAAAPETVLLGAGRDRTASETASDWATYADHVLVVSVVQEARIEPSTTEKERGEGMIGRMVTLRVDRVLWSAPDAPQPAPIAVQLSAAGWVFTSDSGTEKSSEFALRHSSRLEKGHTYVKAVEWVDDPCSDDPKRGSWTGLGSGDTIPFDRGVLGAGEFEGKEKTLAQAKAAWGTEGAGSGIRRQVTGASVETLVAAVQAAKPRTEVATGTRECNPTDS